MSESFSYQRRTAPGTQTPDVTLANMSGSCRDFALLMMEAVRSLGLAARFVSGYLYVPSRDAGSDAGRDTGRDPRTCSCRDVAQRRCVLQ